MNSKQKQDFLRLKKARQQTNNLRTSGALDKLIDTAETVDLTGSQVLAMCNNKVRIVPYHELATVKTIEQLLQPFGAIILLYETKLDYGHYTAVFYGPNNKDIEFFDSYGFEPDQELKYAVYDKEARLKPLLEAYKGGNVIYNNVQLQKWASDVNTCGRWASTRIRMRNKTAQEFNALMSKNQYYDSDWYVSAITYLYTFES